MAALLNACDVGLMLADTASTHRSVLLGHRLLFAKTINYFHTFGASLLSRRRFHSGKTAATKRGVENAIIRS